MPTMDNYACDILVSKQNDTVVTLHTQGTYATDDMMISVDVQSATTAADSASVSMSLDTASESGSAVNIGSGVTSSSTKPSSGYYLKANMSASGNSKVTTPGWVDTGSLASASASDTKYLVLPTGSHSSSAVADKSGAVGITLTKTANASNYGFTTVQPSGTEGTNYLKLSAAGSVTDMWQITPSSTVGTAGYIPADVQYGTAVSGSPTITPDVNADTYIPVAVPSFSGGALSGTGYTKNDLAVTLASGSDTNMTNTSLGSKDTTNYPYYFKVNASTPEIDDTMSVTRGAVTYSNPAGVMSAHTESTAVSSGSGTFDVNVNATSGSTYLGMKQATATLAGTPVVAGNMSHTETNVTLAQSESDRTGVEINIASAVTFDCNLSATTNQAGYAAAGVQLGTGAIQQASSNLSDTLYLKGVTLTKPAAGFRTFNVTVPNGSESTITFVFKVDANGNVTIGEDASIEPAYSQFRLYHNYASDSKFRTSSVPISFTNDDYVECKVDTTTCGTQAECIFSVGQNTGNYDTTKGLIIYHRTRNDVWQIMVRLHWAYDDGVTPATVVERWFTPADFSDVTIKMDNTGLYIDNTQIFNSTEIADVIALGTYAVGSDLNYASNATYDHISFYTKDPNNARYRSFLQYLVTP